MCDLAKVAPTTVTKCYMHVVNTQHGVYWML